MEQNLVLSGTKLQIKKLKPTLNQRKKVLEIYVDKDVSVETKGKQSYYWTWK